MKKTILSITVFVVAALALVMLRGGAVPVVEAQSSRDITPVVTELTPGDGQIEVIWTYDQDKSAPLQGWAIIYGWTDGSGTPRTTSISSAPPGLVDQALSDPSLRNYTIANLANGTQYNVRVFPTFSAQDFGNGSVRHYATPNPEPGKLTGLKVSQQPAASLGVNVSFDAVDGADYYLIRWRESGPGNSLNDGVRAQDSGAGSYTHQIQMSSFGAWVVRVEACNDGGCGPSSAQTVTLTPPPTPEPTPVPIPARPTGMTLTQHNHTLWVLAEVDVVEGADKYNFQWRRAGPGNELSDPSYLGVSVTTETFSHTVTVSDYGAWVIRVEACNDSGCGEAISKTVNLTAAPRPNWLTVTTQQDSLSLDVAWHNVGDYRYKVRLRPPGEIYFHMASVIGGNYTTIEAFRGYGRYTVGVQACLNHDEHKCSLLIEKIVDVKGTTPHISNFEVKDVSVGSSVAAASWDRDPHATHYEVKWRERRKEFSPEHAASLPSDKTSIEFTLPSAYDAWVVRVRACNVNLCGPAISKSVWATSFVEVPQVGEIQDLRMGVKWTSLYGNARWDAEPDATHYKVWYADTATSGMVPHIITTSYHEFYVPGHGTWNFLVQACNDDGCFANAYRLLEVYPPKE